MKSVAYILILWGGIAFQSKAQLTEVYNNNFETAGNESVFIDGYVFGLPGYGMWGWNFTRSTDVAFDGAYSVKISLPTDSRTCYSNTWTYSNAVVAYNPAKSYVLRCKIFVPTSSTLPLDMHIGFMGYFEPFTMGGAGPCLPGHLSSISCNDPGKTGGGQGQLFDNSLRGQWIQLFQVVEPRPWSTPNQLHIGFYLTSLPANYSPAHFYVDDIEILEYNPVTAIADNAVVNGGNIHLNPSGGIPGLPYDVLWYTDTYSSDYYHPLSTGFDKYGLNPGTYKVLVGQFGYTCLHKFSYTTYDVIPLCQTNLPVTTSGTIKLDKHSGQIVFDKGDNCNSIEIGCVEGKVEAPKLSNVIAASATTYSDLWNLDFTGKVFPDTLLYEHGERGKWRSSAAFAYNTPVNYQANERNMIAGRYSLPKFNWRYSTPNTRAGWLQTNSIEKYSQNGEPVEERNALKISSTTKFGYGGSVPYLIAHNADYASVMFESFENLQVTGYEDGITSGGQYQSVTSHSGKYGFSLVSQFSSRSISVNGRSIQIRFWATGFTALTSMSITATSGTATPIKKIAQSGKWSLLESTVTSPGTTVIRINKLSGGPINIDDVRIQPTDSEMTCYVYDVRTLKLLTTFDNQHFGMYYQYNDEGKLVRKQIETEKGIKTIQETQYNTPSINKPL